MFCTRSPSKQLLRSKEIEKELKSNKKKDDSIKILLLGPGDAGKSTFLKQLNLLHSDGSLLNQSNYIQVLQENCLFTMQSLLRCPHPEFKIPPEIQNNADIVLTATALHDVVPQIEALSQSEFITHVFNSRGYYRLSLPCVSEYYWANAARFASDDFLPTTEDMMRSRVKTSGVQTVEFAVDRHKFTVVDVGGQRSERRKWLHCFDNVSAIIFLAPVDDFDMYLEEDDEISRLTDTLSLWSEITSSQFFKPHIWILFLNKHDNLKKKKLNEILYTNTLMIYLKKMEEIWTSVWSISRKSMRRTLMERLVFIHIQLVLWIWIVVKKYLTLFETVLSLRHYPW